MTNPTYCWNEIITPEVEFEDGDTTKDVRTEDKYSPAMEIIMSETVDLLRKSWDLPMGTFGEMSYMDFKCWTLEPLWADNVPFISCIPPGLYRLEKCIFYGGDGVGGKEDYPSYELTDVNDRTEIKIHKGRTIKHTKGCILVGTAESIVDRLWGIQGGKEALDGFMAAMKIKEAKFINIHYPWSKGPWEIPGRY